MASMCRIFVDAQHRMDCAELEQFILRPRKSNRVRVITVKRSGLPQAHSAYVSEIHVGPNEDDLHVESSYHAEDAKGAVKAALNFEPFARVDTSGLKGETVTPADVAGSGIRTEAWVKAYRDELARIRPETKDVPQTDMDNWAIAGLIGNSVSPEKAAQQAAKLPNRGFKKKPPKAPAAQPSSQGQQQKAPDPSGGPRKQRTDRCPDGSHKDPKTGSCRPVR